MNLNQVTLPCADLDPVVAFYRALGFLLIVYSPPRYARFECEAGATFSLHLADGPTPEISATIYFEVADLDACVETLQARGIVFDALPRDQDWLWREAYLRDPSNNRICLYHAGTNRRHPPWRLPMGAEIANQAAGAEPSP